MYKFNKKDIIDKEKIEIVIGFKTHFWVFFLFVFKVTNFVSLYAYNENGKDELYVWKFYRRS